MSHQRHSAPSPISLPSAAAVTFAGNRVEVVLPNGEITDTVPRDGTPLMVCHTRYTAQRVGGIPDGVPVYDVLELFSFMVPTKFCAPSPIGVAGALGLSAEASLYDMAAELLRLPLPPRAVAIAGQMTHWPWRAYVLAAHPAVAGEQPSNVFAVWNDLPELSPALPRLPEESVQALSEGEARDHLNDILIRQKSAGKNRTDRAFQAEYTACVAAAFQNTAPQLVLAEAGTGVGKTLGYLAPAHAFLSRNQSQVWLSTYTKNLQRQIENELETLYPNKAERAQKAVVRKGRENYLCLLNAQEYIGSAGYSLDARGATNAGLLARWIMETRDGDLTGNDFPGWFSSVLGFDIGQLSDKRGECIYAACDHYDRCYVERSRRTSNRAALVIANHALVMLETAKASQQDVLPARYIFDEGHHLFEAADSAFSLVLSIQSLGELRRWILGPEGGLARKRGRSLTMRLEGLFDKDDDVSAALTEILQAARSLPPQGAMARLKDSAAVGATESIFARWREAVLEKPDAETVSYYSVELPPEDWPQNLAADLSELRKRLVAVLRPMQRLGARMRAICDGDPNLDATQVDRITNLAQTLEHRAAFEVQGYVTLIDDYLNPGEGVEPCIDWMELTRADGREVDIGIHRHLPDPMKPFADALAPHAKGVVVTSATLRDGYEKDSDTAAWADAEARCGFTHMGARAEHKRISIASPFQYGRQAKVIVVTDIRKSDTPGLIGAYRDLFAAAHGGGLGLFTAISRLKQVHHVLRDHLPYSLFAQHVDGMDVGTLIDMFRVDEDSCLLGTDAVRDGVDVPGRSLRLLVMDRVPWPRPTILHHRRRAATDNARAYDMRLARLRLKQAFGRLIRTESDKGVFVLLDPSFPMALRDAFPPDVSFQRLTLHSALEETARFLG